MPHISHTIGLVALIVSLFAGKVAAQRAIEMGTDASLGLSFNGTTVFSIAAPISQLRFGFRSGDNMTLEPRGSLTLLSGGGSTLAIFDAGLHVLYDLQPANSTSTSKVYLTGGGNIIFIDGDGANNADVRLGGGVGVRIPVLDRLFWRLEGRLDHQFDSSVTFLTGLAGISFFTR